MTLPTLEAAARDQLENLLDSQNRSKMPSLNDLDSSSLQAWKNMSLAH